MTLTSNSLFGRFAVIASLIALLVPLSSAFAAPQAEAVVEQAESDNALIYIFAREDCKFCAMLDEFVEDEVQDLEQVEVIYLDVAKDDEAKDIFNRLTNANGLPRVTPLTLVGGKMIQGFNSPETTGTLILDGIDRARDGANYDLNSYIYEGDIIKSGSGCVDDPHAEACDVEVEGLDEFVFKLPLIGVVNLTDFSLVSLSAILGFVDGFNPCALWVLVTFLLVLMQIGDRKKMLYVAGLFILVEAIMYDLILNVWYQTWDFVGLDAVVTPVIGLVAMAGGIFFLNKYRKSKNTFTCDVTSMEQQAGIEKKITALVNSPVTLASIVGIIGLAFSVNVIEFACSIGIPQAYTKILELNALTFSEHQFMIFIYIIFYMVDDLIVFGLAFWGIDRLHASYKYTKLSMLIGGILMLLLGALLTFAPDALVI